VSAACSVDATCSWMCLQLAYKQRGAVAVITLEGSRSAKAYRALAGLRAPHASFCRFSSATSSGTIKRCSPEGVEVQGFGKGERDLVVVAPHGGLATEDECKNGGWADFKFPHEHVLAKHMREE
jgi:hypothetical protein